MACFTAVIISDHYDLRYPYYFYSPSFNVYFYFNFILGYYSHGFLGTPSKAISAKNNILNRTIIAL